MTNKWKLSQAAVRKRSCSVGAKHQLISLLRQLTFLYSYHKSVFAHLSIANAHDCPKWDLIVSIQLSHLIWDLIRRGCLEGLQMNPSTSQMNLSSCNRRSISRKLDRRCGNCGEVLLHEINWKTLLSFGELYLNAIWCQCKSNKFNLTANISDVASFSCTTFMPFSIRLIVRLDCLLFDLRDITCWFNQKSSSNGKGFVTCNGKVYIAEWALK